MASEPKIEMVPLEHLTPTAENPNIHTPESMGMIEANIHENGMMRSGVLNDDNEILAGNGTWEAALGAGITQAMVIETDGDVMLFHRRRGLTPLQQLRYKIVDNEATRRSQTDEAFLGTIIAQDKKALQGLFDDKTLDRFRQVAARQERKGLKTPEGEQMDRAEELREKWATAEGQVWLVPSQRTPGRNHRIVIGDSRDPQTWARARGDQPIALLLTSPPYNVGKSYEGDPDLQQWQGLLRDVFTQAVAVCPGGMVNLGDIHVGPHHREVHTYGLLCELLESVGWPLQTTRLWHKPPCWAQGPYYTSSYRPVEEFEFMGLFGDIAYRARVGAEQEWRYRGVWDFPSVAVNDLHPAKYPPELPRRWMLLCTEEGDVVVDPFLGSGTTLGVAEDEGRICVGLEWTPRYVAVALETLQEQGLEPRLEEA